MLYRALKMIVRPTFLQNPRGVKNCDLPMEVEQITCFDHKIHLAMRHSESYLGKLLRQGNLTAITTHKLRK